MKGKVIWMKQNTALLIEHLTKRYGSKEVVSDVNITAVSYTHLDVYKRQVLR